VSRPSRAALAFVVASSVACPSQAQEVLALDAAGAIADSGARGGFSVDGRVGYRTALARVIYGWIWQFEIIGGYRQIFIDTGDLHLGRVGGGLRTGGSIDSLQMFIVSHCSAADANGNWGVLVDLGAAFDWRLKTWSLGVHYAHDFLYLATGWVHLEEIGAHVELRGFWL
jgi:hypothetical protein